LQITGLTNGIAYRCSLLAVSANGVGTPVTFSVSPTASPIALQKVVSRKVHGAAGTFEIIVDHLQPISGAITVEPRSTTSTHLLAFQFDAAITSVGVPLVTDVDGMSIGTATASISGNDIDVVFSTNVSQGGQRVTVQLPGVNANAGTFSSSVALLVGDVNNSRTVNSSDISGVKARSGQTTDVNNFKFDLNASGTINSSDISAVKARSGLALP
jgi:hypothetical protein